jgi:DNA-binding HxlR family transcriptional regulator
METIHRKLEVLHFQEDSFSEPLTFDASVCIMTRILGLMSGRWKPIILYLIKNDVNRFGILQKAMPAISKKVLANQLRELQADELISREVLEEKHPQVVVYHLTEKGKSLRSLIDEMINWGLLNLSVPHSDRYHH